MNDLPLVTCLCLTTAGRDKFLYRAIDCYRLQTYSNRQLLIVADSFSDVEQSLIPSDCPKGIEVIVGCGRKKRNIGEKRNLGCESATGSDLIAVWDDDDYSAPGRLAQQVDWMMHTGTSVTGSDSMLFTDGSLWWKFQYPEGFAAGTSLMFRRDWWQAHPFEEGNHGMRGEDGRFVTQAFEAREFLPFCPTMYATIHPGNTSKKFPDRYPGWTRLPGFKWKD